MKPKGLTEHETGLLEYLEDIIGSNRYVERIEGAAKQLEELNERRQESLDRVKVVEKEKDSVEVSCLIKDRFFILHGMLWTHPLVELMNFLISLVDQIIFLTYP